MMNDNLKKKEFGIHHTKSDKNQLLCEKSFCALVFYDVIEFLLDRIVL